MKKLGSLAALFTLGISLNALAESPVPSPAAGTVNSTTETIDPAPGGGRGISPGESKAPENVPSGGRGEAGRGSGNVGDSSTNAAVNINTASKATLKSDLGLSEAEASAIIQHREKKGPLTSTSDLDAVSGLKSAAVDKIKNRVAFGAAASGTTGTP